MSKPVTVTYKCENGCHTFNEDVLLMEYNDQIYVDHPEAGVYTIGTMEENEHLLGVISAGVVIFEDDLGIFGLLPEHIISIKER